MGASFGRECYASKPPAAAIDPFRLCGFAAKAARQIDCVPGADESVEALSRGPKFGVEAQDEVRLSLETG